MPAYILLDYPAATRSLILFRILSEGSSVATDRMRLERLRSVMLVAALCPAVAKFQELTTRSLENDIDEAIKALTKQMLSMASEVASQVDLSPRCSLSLLQTMLGLRRQDPWALRSWFLFFK